MSNYQSSIVSQIDNTSWYEPKGLALKCLDLLAYAKLNRSITIWNFCIELLEEIISAAWIQSKFNDKKYHEQLMLVSVFLRYLSKAVGIQLCAQPLEEVLNHWLSKTDSRPDPFIELLYLSTRGNLSKSNIDLGEINVSTFLLQGDVPKVHVKRLISVLGAIRGSKTKKNTQIERLYSDIICELWKITGDTNERILLLTSLSLVNKRKLLPQEYHTIGQAFMDEIIETDDLQLSSNYFLLPFVINFCKYSDSGKITFASSTKSVNLLNPNIFDRISKNPLKFNIEFIISTMIVSNLD